MKIGKIIMNPPYSGNLHLKILSHLISLYSDAEIVNLSPIRWLQDPLAEYKKNSDYKKFEDIRKKMADLEVISSEESCSLFDINMFSDLGIYTINRTKHSIETNKPIISQALFDKVNLPTYQGKYKSIYDIRSPEGQPDFSRPFVKMSIIGGQPGSKHLWDWILSQNKNVAMKPTIASGKSGTGIFTVNFETQEEAENFYDYCCSKFVRACNMNVKTTTRWPGYAIPVMPTYTHPWTDKDLYEYFHISDDEIAEIEKEIK